jgi:hypothetical protein
MKLEIELVSMNVANVNYKSVLFSFCDVSTTWPCYNSSI